MEIEKVKELLLMMEKTELEEFEIVIEDDQGEIRLRKGSTGGNVLSNQIMTSPGAAVIGQQAAAVPAPASEEKAGDPETAGTVEINSPIVGTFYSAPAPDADLYVKVGEHIEIGQTVCIVEAMKLMNEIQAEVGGTVVKILVENAQPVEFGQVMFLVKPD